MNPSQRRKIQRAQRCPLCPSRGFSGPRSQFAASLSSGNIARDYTGALSNGAEGARGLAPQEGQSRLSGLQEFLERKRKWLVSSGEWLGKDIVLIASRLEGRRELSGHENYSGSYLE